MDKSLTGIPLSRGSCKKPLRYCSSGCIKIVHAFALAVAPAEVGLMDGRIPVDKSFPHSQKILRPCFP
jgi:hypothetical protein